jgi:hypothetical protein
VLYIVVSFISVIQAVRLCPPSTSSLRKSTVHILQLHMSYLITGPSESFPSLLVLRAKVNADTVDTMPFVLWVSKLLALENVTQMSTTVIAHNLSAHHAQSPILLLSYSTGNRVPEGGPSTPRLKLVVRFIKWRVAGTAGIDAGVGGVLIIFAAARHLGPFLAENAELLWNRVLVSEYGCMKF